MIIDVNNDGKSEILYSASAITCLHGTNGTTKWQTPINPPNGDHCDNRLAAADIDGDGQVEIVYTTSNATLGKLGCLAGRTGVEKWAITTTLNLSGPMILDNKTAGGFPLIITGSSQGNVTCFSNNGTMIWNRYIEQRISPEALGEVDNDDIVEIIMQSANTLYCISSNNGSIKWQRSWPFNNLKNIGLADVDRDGQIEVVIAVPGNATCFSAKDGQIKWSTPCAIMPGCRNLVLCDVGNDGIIDVCILESTGIAALSGMNGSRSVVVTFQWSFTYFLPGLSISDVNMDGKLEFFHVFGESTMVILFYMECYTTDSLAWSRPGPWSCWGGSNSRSQAYIDPDNDTLPTDHELDLQLDPTNMDTDGDDIDDGTEIAMHTDPFDPLDPPSGGLQISHPADVTYEYQDEGNDIIWIVSGTSTGMANYTITCDGEPVTSGNWTSGSSIRMSVDGHGIGTYNYTIVACDGLSGTVQDSVIVIVYNVSPTASHPADVSYEYLNEGNDITWMITDNSIGTANYAITCDGEPVASGNWTSGSSIRMSVDGHDIGTYNYTIVACDGLGGTVQDSVIVIIYNVPPTVLHPADITYTRGSTGNCITWVINDNSIGTVNYTILRNNETVDAGNWTSNTPLAIVVDGLDIGTYYFTLIVDDGFGGIVVDCVEVVVVPSTPGVGPDMSLGFSMLVGFSMFGIGIILAVLKKRRIHRE